MFKNEATILKKENNNQSNKLETNDYHIIKDIMKSMSIFKVNSYDAEVIRRDLIGMSQELSLRGSNLKESIGDDLTGFSDEIINNSAGPSFIEIFLGIIGRVAGFIFLNFTILSFFAYAGLSWDVKPMVLVIFIVLYSISFLIDGILAPIFSTKKGIIRATPSIIGILIFILISFIAEPINHTPSSFMIKAYHVIVASGIIYVLSKYLYINHIHKLTKDKNNFIQDLI